MAAWTGYRPTPPGYSTAPAARARARAPAARAHPFRPRAFASAGQTRGRAVAVVKGWLDRVLEQGLTFKDFRDGLDEAAEAGGITAVNPYHAETVFNTNIQTAYNAGRWEMYHAPEVAEAFPFFQYHTVGDDRVRPAHAAMDGFIARRDDPVWD